MSPKGQGLNIQIHKKTKGGKTFCGFTPWRVQELINPIKRLKV
jgi:hypothetical protein